MKNLLIITLISVLNLYGCSSGMTFEEQIINDLTTKLPSGTCDNYPKGTIISNIKVGKIVDIGLDGMTDVSYTLTYEINGIKKDTTSAMLYLKRGSRYKLAVMGCDSDITND
ncbi:MAG: hypothetical protein IPL23_31400 [Saprospiraceae bacterium]|nr:hypothetical protein [Saprospiraceae bacterium]